MVTIPNFAYLSPRYWFQWQVVAQTLNQGGTVLNVGCSDDPLKFGGLVTHFDYDDWSKVHARFVQGDAHYLSRYVGAKSFDTVVLGDVLEHALNPALMATECCVVARQFVVMTVFKEWRLPGRGQWLKEGLACALDETRKQGASSPEEWQRAHFPLREPGPDTMPYLHHINQFEDEDIDEIIGQMVLRGFRCMSVASVKEPVDHNGHPLDNWLILMEACDAWQASEELENVSRVAAERV